jgi:hypothetical protein
MMMHTVSEPRRSMRSQHGQLWALLTLSVINPLMRRLLASRLHPYLGSDSLMVLSFRGRRTGRQLSFPIGYLQDGSTLICYSPFGWWRNLRGGAPVNVVLRGRTLHGNADVCTDTATVAADMHTYLRHNPGDAKYFRVALDRMRQPVAADVATAAQKNVQIRIQLDA